MKMYLFMNTVPFVIVPVLIIAGILPWPCLLAMLSLYQWNITRTNAANAKGNKKESFMLVPLAFKQNWVFGLLLVIGYLSALYI